MIKDFTIELTKKDIKALNDMNQDLKYLFDAYYISNDIAINVPGTPVLGESFAKITLSPALILLHTYFKREVIKIISDQLYKAIKEHKKDITKLTVKNSDIFLEGDELYHIGRTNLFLNEEDIQLIKEYNKRFSSFISHIEVTESGVIGLVSNECQNIDIGGYKTRITRQLMPGLKKKHKVHVSFEDLSNDLYLMKLMVYRDTIITVHQYRCLKI